MKKLLLLIIILALFGLTGCFSEDDEATQQPEDKLPLLPEATTAGTEPEEPGGSDDSGSAGYPDPTDDSSYPAPELPTRISSGYPAPSPVATFDAYPGGYAIFTRPVGLQCEDPTFADMDAAVAELEAAGIEVIEVSRIEMVVCQACGCPTSEQFRVLVDPADLEATILLGWIRAYE